MVILGSKQIIKSLKPFEDDLRNVGKVGNIEWQESKNQNIKLNFPKKKNRIPQSADPVCFFPPLGA